MLPLHDDCTWNSYSVEELRPLIDFEVDVEVVFIQVPEEVAL